MDLTNVIKGLKIQEKFYSDRKLLEESNTYFETIMYNKNEHEALQYAIKILTEYSQDKKRT